jgi:hypothetical protein
MADAFSSPRLTFKRAKHHINEFKSVANGFINKRPWAMIREADPNFPGWEIHKAKFDEFPEMLPCILADAANNLRSILDQCGYISAKIAGNPTRSVKFSFGSSEEAWRNNLAGGCKDVPAEVRAIFEKFKAYPGGNTALWAMNEIANAQKHFEIKPLDHTPSVFFNAVSVSTTGRIEIVNPGGTGLGWDAEKREIALFSAPAGSDTQIDTNIAFTIAVDGPEIICGESVISLLDNADNIVEGVLVATEAECRRLGFQIE